MQNVVFGSFVSTESNPEFINFVTSVGAFGCSLCVIKLILSKFCKSRSERAAAGCEHRIRKK